MSIHVASVLPAHLLIRESQLTFGPELGRGSFGTVNSGTLNGQPVCIKSFHALRNPELYGLLPGSGSAAEQAVIEELMKEVRMLSSLHHDRIVSLRGLCMDAVTGKPMYIALELADGGSLSSYLAGLGRTVTVPELHGFFEDVLGGTVYIHTLTPPVIHRDLKLENVLVFLTRGTPVLKLGDVGLARFASTHNTSSASSRAGLGTATTGVGSPFYMAPEVCYGRYDAKIDVFSFGVMMAEVVHVYMCGKRVVYTLEGRLAMIESAVGHLRMLGCPLAGVLEKCCDVLVATRLASADALAGVKTMMVDLVVPLTPRLTERERASPSSARSSSRRAETSIGASNSELASQTSSQASRDEHHSVPIDSDSELSTGVIMDALDLAHLNSYCDEVAMRLFGKNSVSINDLARIVSAVGIPGGAALKLSKLLTDPTAAAEARRAREETERRAFEATTTCASGSGSSVVSVSARLAKHVDGTHVATIPVLNGQKNVGLAVNATATMMAVSNRVTAKVTVYEVPSGKILVSFGGVGVEHEGAIGMPWGLCFTVEDTLLIADCVNNCLKDTTVWGVHRRNIGSGVFTGNPSGVAADAEVIAVTQWNIDNQRVMVFAYRSGHFIRGFGDSGSAPGQLSPFGLRITPDGRHVVVAEDANKRLSLFTLGGDFVRVLEVADGKGSLCDVCFADNGDVIGAGWRKHEIIVFSPDGSKVWKRFGSEGEADGLFCGPCAVVFAQGRLYVLDNKSARVQVFD